MAGRIPAQNEYHRFPGHPAATSLSTVFGNLLPVPPDNDASRYQAFDAYFQLVPRGARDGTRAGTLSPRGNVVSLGNNRLFSSVDEFIFNPARAQNNTAITPEFLEKTRFFLTANSQAPEVNQFNLPRIGLWPIQSDAAARNSKDKLIHKASTIGGKGYYFERTSVWPMNGAIEAAVAVGRGTASSQSPTMDWTARNRQLYQYLQRLSATSTPGFGGKFRDKYPQDRDQILTQIFDTIRSGLNTVSGGGVPNYRYVLQGGDKPGERQVVPLVPPSGSPGDGTKGFGRFFTITDAAIQFFGLGTTGTNLSNGNVNSIGAVLIFNGYLPNPGMPGPGADLLVEVDFASDFTVDGNPLGMGSGFRTRVLDAFYGVGQSVSTASIAIPFYRYSTGQRKFGRSSVEEYPFYSANAAPLNAASTSFAFTGGDVTFRIYDPNSPSGGQPLQTITMNFPGGTFMKPGVHKALRDAATTLPNPITPVDYGANVWGNGTSSRPHGETYPPPPLPTGVWGLREVIHGVHVDPTGPSKGDLRHIAALKEVPKNYFQAHANYGSSTTRFAHAFRTGHSLPFGGSGTFSLAVATTNPPPLSAPGLTAAVMNNGLPGDWDNGAGIVADGPYINKPDESNQDTKDGAEYLGGFFNLGQYDPATSAAKVFSPNRQVSSGVVFGSLPTGVKSAPPQPWQTLLFNAHPAAGTGHPGFGTPPGPGNVVPDHLVLDWFQMPVVEPYAISEPLSTAGKINMNYELAPFGHIHRNTGLRAVLKSTRMIGIPDAAAPTYKAGGYGNTSTENFRFALNLDEADGTLRGFENRFDAGDIFRSASEICTISLVPEGPGSGNPGYAGMDTWWSTRRLTGDNARESPYNHIYPRLTTKSNTFTVYYKVQVLKKAANTPAATWVEGRDMVKGESRGSTTIERYVDPADKKWQLSGSDFATDSSATLDSFYRWRVLNSKRFNP